MGATVRKIALLLVGWAFMVAGFVGLFLPLLQGILFLMIGLGILSSQYLWARKLFEMARKRFPGTVQRVDGYLETIRNRVQRMFHRQPGHGN
jgi:uncharacterized protein